MTRPLTKADAQRLCHDFVQRGAVVLLFDEQGRVSGASWGRAPAGSRDWKPSCTHLGRVLDRLVDELEGTFLWPEHLAHRPEEAPVGLGRRSDCRCKRTDYSPDPSPDGTGTILRAVDPAECSVHREDPSLCIVTAELRWWRLHAKELEATLRKPDRVSPVKQETTP